MKKKIIIIITIILVLTLLAFLILYKVFTKEGIETTEEISTETHVDKNTIDWDTYLSYDTKNYENGITITEKGIYTLTGEINGQVIINTTGNVKLILDNVSITSQSGPCILVQEADNVEIYTSEDSTNILTDSSNYTNYEEENGTIFSHDDLILSGDGVLNITANYEDAIVSKDDLTITSGTYIIDSKDDGIRGKESVYITGGEFTIKSLGDGIKATNDTETDKGNIVIDDGKFNIISDLDGLQSENKIVINNGEFNITTGGGSSNSQGSSTWGSWGQNKSATDSTSAKGIKAQDNIVIKNGTFDLNTSDDAIHSNNYVGISNGIVKITSGDDGIHADSTLIIDGVNINIEKSYEGLEASSITINNGEISVIASDDGLNAAGGNDSSSMNRPGANSFNSNSNNKITINDGVLYVNSSGDGLDANGSIYINGGTTTVDGPVNNGNGALDYDQEFVITSGEFIAVGASGMAQGISSNSTQYGVLINLSNTYNSNTVIEILDSSSNVVTSYTSNKSFSSIVISNEKLKNNETYTLKLNGETYTTFTISNINTTVGNAGMGMGGMREQRQKNQTMPNGEVSEQPNMNGNRETGRREGRR